MAKPTTTQEIPKEQQVIDYLRKQNKKYSTTDLSLNLKIPKAQLIKICEELLQNNQIQGKLYGKQYIVQFPFEYDAVKENEYSKELPRLNQTSKELSKLCSDLQSKTKRIKELMQKLAKMQPPPQIAAPSTTTDKIEDEISEPEYKKLKKIYKARMETFNSLQDVF